MTRCSARPTRGRPAPSPRSSRLSRSTFFAKPPRLPFEQAAALTITGMTAHTALIGKAKLRGGKSVFVTGCLGGVGRAGVQIALARGARGQRQLQRGGTRGGARPGRRGGGGLPHLRLRGVPRFVRRRIRRRRRALAGPVRGHAEARRRGAACHQSNVQHDSIPVLPAAPRDHRGPGPCGDGGADRGGRGRPATRGDRSHRVAGRRHPGARRA